MSLLSGRPRHTAAIALLLTSLVTGAAAAPLSPYKALGLRDDVEPHLKAPPVASITAGALGIRLEITPLREVQRRFGGVIRHAGDAGEAVTFLCFFGRSAAGLPVTYWFTSNDEMSGGRNEVSEVAVQAGARSEISAQCAAAPAALTGVDFGVPSVGSTLKVVRKHFAGGRPNAAGQLGYASERPAKRSPDSTVLQSVRYLIHAGVVRTISVSQVTSG
jgi:hypothetical protein